MSEPNNYKWLMQQLRLHAQDDDLPPGGGGTQAAFNIAPGSLVGVAGRLRAPQDSSANDPAGPTLRGTLVRLLACFVPNPAQNPSIPVHFFANPLTLEFQ